MFDELNKNIEQEKNLVKEIKIIYSSLSQMPEQEKEFYLKSIQSLKNQLKILNNSMPLLLNEIILKREEQKENKKEEKKNIQELKPSKELLRMSYTSGNEKKYITINKEDKEKFVKELNLSEVFLKRLNDKPEEKIVEENKPSRIAGISNKIFSRLSEKISPQFSDVRKDLKQANIKFQIDSYVSIALFVSSIIFVLSFLIVLAISIFVSSYGWIWLPFAFFIASLIFFYIYPSSEKGSIEKGISDELPFATIYMAAISNSDIEPTKIFKIIGESPEYPNIGMEIKRIIHQTDIYGYDLVSALKTSSQRTPNKSLSELFSGLSTNIVSGGSLKNYLEKKAENLMLDYKLKRQKYSSLAETFMDVYISILITAPLVLMMLVIIMSISGVSAGLSVNTILILTIGGVVLVNLIFLAVLKFKQPKL